jgi:hypothetical protein
MVSDAQIQAGDNCMNSRRRLQLMTAAAAGPRSAPASPRPAHCPPAPARSAAHPLIYQRATSEADRRIADRMSALVDGVERDEDDPDDVRPALRS